jgi:hypothetical protein
MRGIRFIVDDDGRRRAVVLDLKVHGKLWQDIYDQLSTDEDDEARVPYENEELEEEEEIPGV